MNKHTEGSRGYTLPPHGQVAALARVRIHARSVQLTRA